MARKGGGGKGKEENIKLGPKCTTKGKLNRRTDTQTFKHPLKGTQTKGKANCEKV